MLYYLKNTFCYIGINSLLNSAEEKERDVFNLELNNES